MTVMDLNFLTPISWPNEPDLQDFRLPPPYGWTNTALATIAAKMNGQLFSETDQLAIAWLLRDQVARSPMETPPDGFDWALYASDSGFTGQYANSVRDRLYGHHCGGRTIEYLSVLKAFGLKGRAVFMWPYSSGLHSASFVHVSSEVEIGGRYIASDAHYNTSLRDDANRLLSWQEARTRLMNGLPVNRTFDGLPPLAAPLFEYYSSLYNTTLAELVRYMIVGISAGVSAILPATMLSPANDPNWNGVVGYANGSTFDARAMAEGDVYQSLIL
jgi:hypothetical protein